MAQQGIATALEDAQRVIDERRETYYATPPVEKGKHDKDKDHFLFQFPMCLLPTVFERQSVDLILAYSLVYRTKLHDHVENPDHANLEDLMSEFKLDMELTVVKRLAAEAEQRVDEYQAWTGEKSLPWVRLHQGLFVDAYNGDLSLPCFAVYGAVKSMVDFKAGRQIRLPKRMTAKQILRRVNGFTNTKSYDCRRESFTINLNERMVYHYTKKLAARGFFERATVGLWTWYATREILNEREIKSLKAYALNIAKRNMAKAAKVKDDQLEIELQYRKLKEDFAERDRQRREHKKRLVRHKAVKEAEQTVDLDQLPLPFKIYRPEQIHDKRAVRHRLKSNGKTWYTLTQLDKAQIDELYEKYRVTVY